jgi:hypothetical protein
VGGGVAVGRDGRGGLRSHFLPFLRFTLRLELYRASGGSATPSWQSLRSPYDCRRLGGFEEGWLCSLATIWPVARATPPNRPPIRKLASIVAQTTWWL